MRPADCAGTVVHITIDGHSGLVGIAEGLRSHLEPHCEAVRADRPLIGLSGGSQSSALCGTEKGEPWVSAAPKERPSMPSMGPGQRAMGIAHAGTARHFVT